MAQPNESVGVELIKHSNATGGVLLVYGEPFRLTPIQFTLFEVLAKQAFEDAERPEPVRGFISSYELLCSLPWDAHNPDEGHLKQLVRRLRRRLVGSNISIEARQGLGYRLTLGKVSQGPGFSSHPTSLVTGEGLERATNEFSCEVCDAKLQEDQLLCPGCARRLTPPIGALPEHVLSSCKGEPEGWLADGWGGCHPLVAHARVGRSPDSCIRILDGSVSREHAQLTHNEHGWFCRDLGSRNGTFIDGKACAGESAIARGSIVRFGQLAFMLLSQPLRRSQVPHRCALTIRLGA